MISTQEKSELRQRLLESDSGDAGLRAQYERKLNAMFETQLSMPKKIWFKFLVLFSILSGGTAVTLAITESLPPGARVALLVGAAFAGAWVVYLAAMLWRGKMRRRIDPPIAAGMGFVFSILMCTVMALAGARIEQVLLMGMLILVPAGLILIRTVVEQSELRTQERLLELQYEISRLADKLGDDDGAGAGVRR